MNVQKVAEGIISKMGSSVAEFDADGVGTGHALWMLQGIAKGYIQYEKAHRWLGYAQSALVHADAVSLFEMKEANKNS